MLVHEGEVENKESPFRSTICNEDLLHIKAIKETDIGATSLQRLTEIFYKTLMKPVQGHFILSFHNCFIISCIKKYLRMLTYQIYVDLQWKDWKICSNNIKMGCKTVVRVGTGGWWNYAWDGHKFVCEDDFIVEEPWGMYFVSSKSQITHEFSDPT